jgi:hypothetical protein
MQIAALLAASFGNVRYRTTEIAYEALAFRVDTAGTRRGVVGGLTEEMPRVRKDHSLAYHSSVGMLWKDRTAALREIVSSVDSGKDSSMKEAHPNCLLPPPTCEKNTAEHDKGNERAQHEKWNVPFPHHRGVEILTALLTGCGWKCVARSHPPN